MASQPHAMSDPRSAFIIAACVPRNAGHGSGTITEADAILAAHADLPRNDIHIAAILGDGTSVRQHLARDTAAATATGGPHGWDPLTHLCFSRYLRLDRSRSAGFVEAATALLDAGANPATGFYEAEHQPAPEWECVLYGAAGIAHHAELTRLLLARGADPNDGEVTYHTPEGYDNAALKALLDSGKLSADSLANMLLRKADWHDLEGLRLLLEYGADPNRLTHWRTTTLHHAVLRDNALESIDLLLDRGGDPLLVSPSSGLTPARLAIRRGRPDVLESLDRRGIGAEPEGVERLIAACARGDEVAVKSIAAREPDLVRQLHAGGGKILAEFSGNANTAGVRLLLDLGVPVAVRYAGDGYFGIAPDSTPLHVAAWRARHDVVRLLLMRRAPVDAQDGQGRTPLQLAVKACVASYWSDRRSPDSVEALLAAGASTDGIPYPSGYEDIDRLLRPARP